MEWFRDRKKRLYIAALAGMAAAVLTAGRPDGGKQPESAATIADRTDTGLLAWWGTMYPRFCFSEIPGEEETGQIKDGNREVKISFWIERWFS